MIGAALIDGLFGIGQQVAQNDFARVEAEKNRNFQSAEADKNRQFQAEQAEIAFEREQEYYDKNLSFSSQVKQMQEAGLNPAMMYGGNTTGGGTPPASAAPSGSMPTGSAASANPMGMVSFFEKMLDIESKQLDNETKEQNLDLDKRKTEMEIELMSAQESREYMTIKHMQSDIEVNENKIKVGNSEFEVNMSQRDLNHVKQVLETMNAKQVEALTPVMVDYYTAQTEESRESALLKIAQAAGVKVESELHQAQTSKTETDEKLGTADTIMTGVGTALSVGELILEGAAEIFGFSETLGKYKSQTTYKDKNGKVIRSVETTSSKTSSNKSQSNRVSKKRRKR